MKLVTSEMMTQIDKSAQLEFGIKSIVLMENAGLQSFLKLKDLFPLINKKKVVIFAGSGKNAGDGLVLARHLFNHHITTEVILLAKEEEIKAEDTRINLRIARSLGIKIINITDYLTFENIKESILKFDILIDAILGIGIKKEVKGLYREIIRFINTTEFEAVIALDIPSGIDPNKGLVLGEAVKANHTFCFGLPKLGLFIYPGAEYAGNIHTLNISLPLPLIENINIKYNLVVKDLIKNLLPKKRQDIHKYQNGVILFVGGSLGMAGASYLASKAAYAAGGGIVILAIPKSINYTLQTNLPEAITKPQPETDSGTLSLQALPNILELTKKADVIIIGCGLSKNEESLELIRRLIANIPDKPIVLDGDGISAFVDNFDLLKNKKIVITPHLAEFSYLIKLPKEEIKKNKLKYVEDITKELEDIILVLKGKNTIIASSEEVYINTVGGKELAKAGTGDVLTGIIGGLIAQGLNTLNASIVGVYLHGLAGEIYCQTKRTDFSLLASELIDFLPFCFEKIIN